MKQKEITIFLRKYWSTIFVWILFIIGFLLRLLMIWKNPIEPKDALQYMEIAEFIFGVDGTSYIFPREPLYPFLLGLIYLVFPNTYLTAQIFSALMGSLVIVGIFYVTKKYAQKFSVNVDNEKFGIVASLLVCFNYHFVIYDGGGVREPLFTLLFLILLYSVFIERKKIKKSIFCFSAFFLILTKSESLILLIGISILIFHKENILKRTRSEENIIEENGNEIKENIIRETRKNKLRNYLSKINYNFVFILLGLFIGFALWKFLSYLLFSDPFATSNWMARMYYFKEFNLAAPETLTTFEYLFKYHGIKDLLLAFYHGFFGLMTRYSVIFNRYLFALFILSLIKYLIKKDNLSIFWLLYPPLVFSIVAFFWGMVGYNRILQPYSIVSIISIPIFTYEIIDSFKLTITKKLNVDINKTVFYYLIFTFICIYYMLEIIQAFVS